MKTDENQPDNPITSPIICDSNVKVKPERTTGGNPNPNANGFISTNKTIIQYATIQLTHGTIKVLIGRVIEK